MDKNKLFVRLWLVAFIAIVVSIIFPWWYNVEERQEYEFTERYESVWSLTQISTSYDSDVSPDGDSTVSYSDQPSSFDRIREVWVRTFAIVIMALAVNLAVFWVWLRYRNNKTNRTWVVTLTALAAVVTIIAPLFLMIGLPPAIDDNHNAFHFPESEDVYTSFWGDKEHSKLNNTIEVKYEWGPHIGWIMFWVAFGMDLFMLLAITWPAAPTNSDRLKTPAETISPE
jgi:amino acid transporter